MSSSFVSVPKDQEDKLRKALKDSKLCPFSIPQFKVGTLDSLMTLSDELIKTDSLAEQIVLKIADSLKMLSGNDPTQYKQMLVIGDRNIDAFLENFSWNTMKYRSDKTLMELAQSITQELQQTDSIMKSKLQAYSQTKNALLTQQRSTGGNLAVKSLAEYVKKEHFILDSEYLTTLLVAVPKSQVPFWLNSYERLTEMVVPASSQKIAQDDEYELYNVVLFKRVLDEFSNKCRENKYGLPPDFQAFYVKSKPGNDFKMGALLNKHFQAFENTKSSTQVEEDYQQLMGEYCAVVYYSLNTFE